MAMRIGHGYDLHRLEPCPPIGPGRPLIIGGVTLDHDHGPISHSDGDTLTHAITDALLGAISARDIGQLFPNDDPDLESASSRLFLIEAVRQVRQAGWRIVNIDATVVLETPRLGPHKETIRATLGGWLGLDPDQINVKAKTHEGVDAVGSGRAIEAHAVVLIERTDE